MKESELTSATTFFKRREILRSMGFAGGMALMGSALPGKTAQAAIDATYGYEEDKLGVPLTPFEISSRYNNFYEFGSHKEISEEAQALKTNPWSVSIEGLVEKERELDFADILRIFPIEDRYYRFRCVEAWAMAVPWRGFPLRKFVEIAAPLSSARYVVMETAEQEDTMPGLRQHWYPWPYREIVTIEEAANDLAFLVTGIYGEDLPKQYGAPLRLVLPWKYGFKSIKSIVTVRFVEERPKSFWEELNANEYGFWANVNPEVSHPRWSQASERDIGTKERRPTLLYNGYGDAVASLYPRDADDIYFR